MAIKGTEGIELNKKQLLASGHKDGPAIVVAGPGSGKTTVIMKRIENLINIHNVPVNDILVISFAKAAAEEMKDRFDKLMGINKNPVTFSTFHSFFYKILRSRYDYGLENIIGKDVKKGVIRKILRYNKVAIEDNDDFLDNILNEISKVKNEIIDIEYHNSFSMGSESFKSLYRIYEQWKNENGKIDFDDMLVKCYNLLLENKSVLRQWSDRYKYIMIDEFQDINRVQYETIKLIGKKHNNLFVVGDDDQSIYRFRGSRPEFLLNFEKDFENSKRYFLDINYRSTDNIIELCNKVISNNKKRISKEITGTSIRGKAPVLLLNKDIRSEGINIAKRINSLEDYGYENMAVAYRTNIQSRAFVDAFMDAGIPFVARDEISGIYSHWVAGDVFAYFDLALNREDDKAFKRVINKPYRYISSDIIAKLGKGSKSMMEKLYNGNYLKTWQFKRVEELTYHLNRIRQMEPYEAVKYLRREIGYDKYINEYAEYKKISTKALFETLNEIQESVKGFDSISDYLCHVNDYLERSKNGKNNKNTDNVNGVTLSTIHGMKGLEFDIVFVASVNEGILPHEKSKTSYEIEEECRLLYVACTRAKERLFISVLKTKYEQEIEQSRFLEPILSRL